MKTAAAILALLLVACGGNGEDEPAAQPAPPAGSREVTLADTSSTSTQLVPGGSVAVLLASFGGPAFTLPAGTTSAEACATVRWGQETGGAAALTMDTQVTGIAGGELRQSAAADLAGAGATMLETTRCGAVNVATPSQLALSVRVNATNPVMFRYTATVRWTVKAVVP